MVESWNIGMGAHDSYAKRVESMQDYQETYQLAPSETDAIVHHTTILKLKPEVPAIVLLLRQNKRKTWADFTVPKEYFQWRRSRSYCLDPNEKIEADLEKLSTYVEQHGGYGDDTEESEGHTLMRFLNNVGQYNRWVDEVEARTRQFLQG